MARSTSLPAPHDGPEEFARIGGRPLGLAFDKGENLWSDIAGMGVYGVKPHCSVFKVTSIAPRARARGLKDDSRLDLADHPGDVVPDGKIYLARCLLR